MIEIFKNKKTHFEPDERKELSPRILAAEDAAELSLGLLFPPGKDDGFVSIKEGCSMMICSWDGIRWKLIISLCAIVSEVVEDIITGACPGDPSLI